MSFSLKRRYRVSRQSVFSTSRSVFILSLLLTSGFWILASLPAPAIVDTNNNTLSDIWEKYHNNGNLLTNLDPQADPDGDGWTNIQEAAAGTNPFNPNPPNGFIRPNIVHIPATYITGTNGDPEIFTPEAITLTWPTLPGKQYTLHYSPDLSEGSWQPISAPFTGSGSVVGTGVTLTQPDGSTPPKIFLKVAIADQDTDSDTLTDAEEAQLGTNALLNDSDSDGMPDAWEISQNLNPLTNDSAQDPDHDGFTNLQEFQNGTNPRVTDTSADSDGNGLSDSWELQHFGRIGVNPDEDNDRDEFTNIAEQSGGTDPQDQASYPPGTPLPNGAPQLVGEQLTFSGTRWGEPGFQNTAKKYLKSVYHTVNTVTPGPDTLGFAGDETVTVTTDVRTGEQTHSSTGTPTTDWASLEPWIVASDVSRSHSGIHSPWDVNSSTSQILSDEYTIPTFVANVESWCPAYQNKFTVAVPWFPYYAYTPMFHTITAHISLTPEATDPYPAFSYYITKLKYKWKVNAGQSQVVNWLEVFTPADGSSLSAEDKSWAPSPTDTESPVYEIDPTTKNGKKNGTYSLLPVEVAPEVLAVNSDFDEGRIDPATGYAIPDCDDMPGVDQKTGSGNTQIALNASRAHLDGLFANDEKVTDDMHKSWFGVNPNQLGDDFWNGANVTIRKIDKDDPDTGFKESGQVRFYAKWSGGYYGIAPYDFQTLQPVNLVSAGVNGNNGSVYGASSTIPDGAEFYMEGVRPGKITLEWRLQKGAIDVKHEQTFKVETRKTVAQWQEEVRYQIRLQTKVKSGTEVDVALYHPGNGFRNANAAQDNVLRVVAIYDYYQQLFKQMPEKFMWAGMAKVAAAPIYAGMSDLNTWWQATGLTPPWPPYQGPGDRDYGVEVFIEGLLLSGQKAIFEDMAWSHRAYKGSGIWALKYLSSDFPDATNYNAWISMDGGIQANNLSTVFQANGDLLRREQQEVVQQNYNSVQNLQMRQPPAHPNINGGVTVAVDANGLANAGEWLSANSNNNPLPGGPGFRATFPGARLDFFNDRWAWTSNTASGMLQIWTGASTSAPGFDAGRRASENGKTIKAAASAYSYDPAGLP